MTHRGEGANIRYVSIEGLSVGRVASKNIECRLANLFSSITELNISIQDEIPSGEVDDGHHQQTESRQRHSTHNAMYKGIKDRTVCAK